MTNQNEKTQPGVQNEPGQKQQGADVKAPGQQTQNSGPGGQQGDQKPNQPNPAPAQQK